MNYFLAKFKHWIESDWESPTTTALLQAGEEDQEQEDGLIKHLTPREEDSLPTAQEEEDLYQTNICIFFEDAEWENKLVSVSTYL